MPIILITGPSGTGKSTVANALRNNQIAFKRGALLVDETTDGHPVPLLEKILAGVPLQPGVDAAEQKWKPECAVILVGDMAAKALPVFEQLAPGFTALHGPVFTVTCGKVDGDAA